MTTEVSFVQTAILGVVQGVTEFLPISSDGHLALGQRLLHTSGGLEMTVLLHAGTLLATFVIFRKEVVELFKALARMVRSPGTVRSDVRAMELIGIFVASVPTAIVGLALKKHVEAWSSVPWIVGVCFLGTGAALLASRFGREEADFQWTPTKAFLVGIAQGLAVLPGLSRSACTLASALLLGAPPKEAFRFSFLLSLPAVGGALLLELKDPGALSRAGGMPGVFGAVVAFFVGLVALLALRGVVSRGKLWAFALYVIPLALLTLTLR
ncbi:MAG: undecaprenyl-diphosphate phosphatase [Deltaproteobacteria bacterium]|nr:undecaprenyl-diphosphate phosphatase [Deltaproteobacteria bacterium]